MRCRESVDAVSRKQLESMTLVEWMASNREQVDRMRDQVTLFTRWMDPQAGVIDRLKQDVDVISLKDEALRRWIAGISYSSFYEEAARRLRIPARRKGSRLHSTTAHLTATFARLFHRDQRISLPPGARLAVVSRIVFGRRAYHRVFQQTIEDMREEYNEALAAGSRSEAAMARIRGCFAVLKAAGLHTILKWIGRVLKTVTGQ
jgi:hypothetical protein